VRGADGSWEMDPDAQVRERLNYLFESFRRYGVARSVVRDLKREGLDLPVRVMSREGHGSLLWKTPTLSAVVRILHNPAYAGVYVFGRWAYSGERRSPKTGKVLPHQVSVTQWPVKIEAHHPAYLSWEEYVKNCERMNQNWNHGQGKAGVVREGNALLQGIVYCGRCGRKMGVNTILPRKSDLPPTFASPDMRMEISCARV